MSDFFFDTLDNEGNIDLSDLAAYADITTPKYFKRALNRCLRDIPNNRIIASDASTHPAGFAKILSLLDADDIGLTVIGRRTDVNDNVKYTLDCQLLLEEGILHVQPHWTAYKEIRAEEIVTTLLRPLMKKGLFSRTFINDNYESNYHDWQSISELSEIELVSIIFNLAGYPIEPEDAEPYAILLVEFNLN